MTKQEIITYNLDQLSRLDKDQKETILADYTEQEPGYYTGCITFHCYKKVPGGWDPQVSKPTKYTCTVLIEDGNMYQFGFSNRNRLRNRIKHIQSIHDNVAGKIIAEQVNYKKEKKTKCQKKRNDG